MHWVPNNNFICVANGNSNIAEYCRSKVTSRASSVESKCENEDEDLDFTSDDSVKDPPFVEVGYPVSDGNVVILNMPWVT